MMATFAALTMLVAAWVAARRFGPGRPCPALIAAVFDNRIVDRFSGVATLINRAGVTQRMRVLDAGCGPGRLTIPLARRVGPRGEVVALDVQQRMLARVDKRVRREHLGNVRTLHAALGTGAPALRDHAAGFDRAILCTVLGEIPDKATALREIATLLATDGVLSVTELIIDPDYQPHRRVVRLAESAGFRLESTFGNALAFTINFRKS